MGAALLMAYKTAPISAVLIVLAALRGRRKGLGATSATVATLGGFVVVQVVLDRAVYGTWGASLFSYFGDNLVGVGGRVLRNLGLGETAARLYMWYWDVEQTQMRLDEPTRQIQPTLWYLDNLREMLVWPVLMGILVGLARCVRQASWISTLMVIAVVVNLALLHQKAAKEFRLWLPLLPMLGPLAGWGLAWIWGRRGARQALRPLLVCGMLVGSGVLAADALMARNVRKFAGYWDAIDYVSHQARDTREVDPERGKVAVTSAYHWAVYLREGSDIELRKLPHQMTNWASYDDAQKFAVFDGLRQQEWLIVHQPVLTNHPELMHRVNAWFQIEALFWDREDFEDIGPIFVMKRKLDESFSPDRRTFFEILRDGSEEEARQICRQHGRADPIRLIRPQHKEELWFLGFDYEGLPGDGHGWITYYFYAPTRMLADYELVARLTTFDERHAWQNNAPFLYQVFPCSTWGPGTIVRESWPVVAAEEPYDWSAPYRPMGGAYRRGDCMPAFLWIDVATFHLVCEHCAEPLLPGHSCDGVERSPEEGTKEISGRMVRARWGADAPLRRGELVGIRRSEEGWRWSADDLIEVGRFFLPVHEDARVPDDGRPIE